MYQTQIIGNLGRDARLQQSQSGFFVSFSVGVRVKDSTIWFDCTLNGENPNLAPYLKKGTKVFCSGSQSSKIYQDGHGIYQISHNLNVRYLELCGSKIEEQRQTAPTSSLPPVQEENPNDPF